MTGRPFEPGRPGGSPVALTLAVFAGILWALLQLFANLAVARMAER
jgi:hypothetical protein